MEIRPWRAVGDLAKNRSQRISLHFNVEVV